MAYVCKNLDETLLAAAGEVVAERFCPEAAKMLRRLFANPALEPGDDIGSVVCDGDRVVGVSGAIARRLYFGRESLRGINGGFLSMRRDAPATLLFALLKHSHRPREGNVLFYSNTCSPATAKIKPCVGVKNHGPESWTCVRYAVLRHYPAFRRRVARKLGLTLPKRLPFFAAPVSPLDCVRDGRVFAADRGLVVRAKQGFGWADEFFEKYLSGNDGVTGSRTTRELEWFFGDSVATGKSIAIAAEGTGGVEGYVVASPCMYDPERWLVVDAIALGNSAETLGLLFLAAKRAVLACSGASRLEVIGFPDLARHVVERHFPRSRPTPCNEFAWGFSDPDSAQRCESAIAAGKGWFFGPYDGDLCLCPQ